MREENKEKEEMRIRQPTKRSSYLVSPLHRKTSPCLQVVSCPLIMWNESTEAASKRGVSSRLQHMRPPYDDSYREEEPEKEG